MKKMLSSAYSTQAMYNIKTYIFSSEYFGYINKIPPHSLLGSKELVKEFHEISKGQTRGFSFILTKS